VPGICPNDGAYLYEREDGGHYCVYPGCDHEVAPSPEPVPAVHAALPPTPAMPLVTRPAVAQPAASPVSVPVPAAAPSAPTPIPPPTVTVATEIGTESPFNVRLLAVLVVLAIVGIVGFLIYNSRKFSVRVEKALAAGRIFAPPGDNVVDLWTAEQARNPGSADLAPAAARIQATLAPKGEDAFVRWYRDSDDKVDWDEQARLYAFLSRLNPGDATFKIRSLYAAGQRDYRAGSFAAAIASYQNSIGLDPCYVLALNGVGKVYVRKDSPFLDLPTAVQHYERAVRCDAAFTWAHFNLGSHYMSQGQWKTAERHMRDALRTSPKRASILRALGRISYNLERYPAALQYYQDSLRTESDPSEIARAHRAIEQIQKKLQ
jgi:tetratricopeptide (TPR) repeat protein